MHDQVIKPEWDQLKGKAEADEATGTGHGAIWAKGWAQRYGCDPKPTDTKVGDDVIHRVYSCPAAAPDRPRGASLSCTPSRISN